MTRIPTSLCLLLAVSACGDGQPLFDIDDEDLGVEAQEILDENTEEGDLTTSQETRGDIVRLEAPNDIGGGVATDFVFNGPEEDTFSVDGLAFDGFNTYQRFAALPSVGDPNIRTVSVYRADIVVPDFLTGDDVGQLVPTIAIYDESTVLIDPDGNIITELTEDGVEGDPRVSFAIARTGGITNGFGFGGYTYERAGGVVLPTTGQAGFTGTYAGTRIFEENVPTSTINGRNVRNNIEITTAEINIAIDFDDFNTNPGVSGILTNRRHFDPTTGEEIPSFNEVSRFGQSAEAVQLLDLPFVIVQGEDTISEVGEIAGGVSNSAVDRSGNITPYEVGEYQGIIAGDLTQGDGGEVVGVIVFEVADSRYNFDINAQETGGFIATR